MFQLVKSIYLLTFGLFTALASLFIVATYAPDKRAEIIVVQLFDTGIAM